MLLAGEAMFGQPGVLTPDLPRPKVGLALSGGGAIGLAHIGVIKWLEENHIPVDYVAGTSMGGLVGGAYSTGLDAEELQQLIQEIDWTTVLRGSPSYDDLSYRRKEDQRDYPARLEFGLRGGFNLPVAFNPGHEAGMIFDHIALPYSDIESFNLLPTPFRCVATDLVSGREVVMADGSLAGALRATMAIPGVFAPIERDNMVLVDGGLLNNLPVDVVLAMGADIVIAVDLGNEKVEEKQLQSVFGVADRVISVVMRVNVQRNAKLARHLIQPEVHGVGMLDFSKPQEIISVGYNEVETTHGEMRYLALNEADWQEHLEARQRRRLPRAYTPEFIAVAGDEELDDPLIESKLGAFAGKPLDEGKLQDTLTHFTGWGLYDKAAYRKVDEGSEDGLEVRLHRKSYGPPFLKPIFKINAGQSGDMTFEVAARATLYDVGHRNNELRIDGSFGRTNLLGAELYQYLGDSGWFVAPRAFGQYQTQFLFQDGDRIADYGLTVLGMAADLGYNSGRSGEIRAGVQYGWQKANVRSGSPLLPEAAGAATSVYGQWRFDRLNSSMVPTDGIAFLARTAYHPESPGSSGSPTQFDGRVTGARPLTRLWSAQYELGAGGTFRGEAGPLQEFTMGGPSRIGALGLDERRGNHYVYSRAGVLRLIKQTPGGIVEKIYAGGSYEGGDAFDDKPHWVHAGSFGLTGETRLGLFYLGGSVGEGTVRFYLSVGKFF